MKRVYPYHLKDIIKVFKDRQKNRFDINIVIDGPRGNGKSTFAYKIATRFKNFIPKNDIIYSRDDVNKALASKKFGIIFCDEAINVGYKRDFWEKQQKDLIKMLNMYRDSCNLFILCVPSFSALDKDLRDLMKFRFTIDRRGIAIFQMSKGSLYSSDPWDIKYNQKIEAKWVNKYGNRKPLYRQLSTYKGIVKFGDLSERSRKIYENIKFDKRNHIIEQQLKTEENKEHDMISEIITLVKDGKFKEDDLITISKVSGKRRSVLISSINKRLKDAGEGLTLMKLIKLGGRLNPSEKDFSHSSINSKSFSSKKVGSRVSKSTNRC